MTTTTDQPTFVPSSDSERLTKARNNVLLSHAALLGVMQEQHLLDGEPTERINASLAAGGGMGVESFVDHRHPGIVGVTTVSAQGDREVICTVPDMRRGDMN